MATPVVTPVDRFLDRERRASAVERFSQWHDQFPDGDDAPALAGRYRNLLPAAPPGPGQQYAFEVDLDACSGCKACVVACNRMNGLDPDEAWRSVGLLVGVDEPFQQTVTTACHHCLDPGCLTGCPVEAYEKDPVTGIVAHLDDQCIGCGYCTFTCPYEVPRYNPQRGIVRKCDMCTGRLAEGEAPACVQSCPTGAIAISVVDVHDVAARAESGAFLPGAPDPRQTRPATRYRSRRPLPAVVAADHFTVRAGDPHPPLAAMLVLTQVAVGAAAAGLAFRGLLPVVVRDRLMLLQPALVLLTGLVALAASLFHLGRPRYAFRAALGLRRSWLSREIVAFGVFAGLAGATAASSLLGWGPTGALELATVASGGAGVACSVMIYAATRRPSWTGPRTAIRFAATTAAGGVGAFAVAALLIAVSLGDGVTGETMRGAGRSLGLMLAAIVALKLAAEAWDFSHLRSSTLTDLKRSALLLRGELRSTARLRYALGLAGGIVAPLVVVGLGSGPAPSAVAGLAVGVPALVALVAGELTERRIFFAASTAPRMPGGLP